MKYALPLSYEDAAAKLSMPRTPEGYVISLMYLPPHLPYFQAYELAWKDWLRKHPQHLWPAWVEPYAAKVKKLRQGETA